ncbi:hypothetical protein [Coxiella endosymbiont of Ornithodoros amblus]|uniref:hypothetical protein n=1 Tax=Coxiella endosymbiont of Ornithodoros amblus TaxID=1656166 RepID=UPI00244DBF78|nr:hypothetical protein [Coxiella endosymbiont of Ornithodoros amblus]
MKAASIRPRPILMTTAAMVFGALPLLFLSGGSHKAAIKSALLLSGDLLYLVPFSRWWSYPWVTAMPTNLNFS